ncbi:MAG: DUF6443 domain-containing protein, partial [Bacteroidota bacterium]
MKTNPYIFSILLFFISGLTALAQPQSSNVKGVVMPAPNAAALGKYGDIPISHYTGVPNIGIPIYTVQQGPLSLPVSLSYHASGIKLGEMASWVGLGWSLGAGGMISRTIQGLPDESPGGYYNTGGTFDIGDASDNLAVVNRTLDTEPDIFTISVAGFNGKFYIDHNQNVTLIPHQDIKISVDYTGNGFTAFTMTAPNGDRYIFGRAPGSFISVVSTAVSTGQPSPNASSWHLVRVESQDGQHQIDLTYAPERYGYKTLSSCRYLGKECVGGGVNGNTGYNFGIDCSSNAYDPSFPNNRWITTDVNGFRLSQISSNTCTVDFNGLTDREDLDDSQSTITSKKRLDNIEISAGTFCKSFRFRYDYFQDNLHSNVAEGKRLKLKSLEERSCSGSPTISLPKHEFTYEGEVINGKQYLPYRLSKATDHWGFFNGAHSNNNLAVATPATTVVTTGGNLFSYGAANKESNETFMKKGVLKRIKYPTGGHTEFTYEGNRVSTTEQSAPMEKLILQTSAGPYPTGLNCTNVVKTGTASFSSQEEISNSQFQMWLVPAEECPNAPNKSYKIEAFLGSSTTLIGSYSFNISNNAKNFTFPISQLGTFSPQTTYTFKLTTNDAWGKFYLYYTTPVTVQKIVGGLRIKQTRTHDGISDTTDIVKAYEYVNPSIPTQSSGRLLSYPAYSQEIFGSETDINNPSLMVSVTAVTFNEYSVVPLGSFQGYHIGYTDVKEIHKDEKSTSSDNGTISYKFKLSLDYDVLAAPYPIPPYQIQIGNGKMSEREIKNDAGSTKYKEVISDLGGSYYSSGTQLIYKSVTFPPCSTASSTSFIFFTPYTIKSGAYRVASTTITQDGVETTTTTGYDPLQNHLQPTSSQMVNSDGYTTLMEYKYPYDKSGAVYTEMIDRNIILPVEQRITVNGQLQDGTETVYQLFSGHPYPQEFKRYEEGSWESQGVINSYANGFPTQYTHDGWESENYNWTTAGLIQSRTFKDFSWSYEYHPGTRLIKKITDIDGQFTEYDYDPLMRLQSSSARNGNVVTNYTYYYKGSGSTHNHVKTRTDFTPVGGSEMTFVENWQYLDGIGRMMQTVQRQHSPSEQDIVTAVAYDNQGRVFKQYEPFESTSNTGAFRDVPSGTEFTLNEYYLSPLNRIHKVTPPNWYPTTTTYGSNGGGVANYSSGPSFPTGSLSKVNVTDPEGLQTTQYTDKKGRLVFSRQRKGGGWLDTYYAYDFKDRLTHVIPPSAGSTSSPLSFKYEYDGADNMTRKYVPDMGWMEMVYDDRNLLIASQDPKLAAEEKWLTSLIDGYGRVTQSGFFNNSTAPNPNAPSIDYPLLENFYDGDGCSNAQGQQYNGKVCQSRSRILQTNQWLESNFVYDIHGRIIEVEGNNHLNTNAGSERIYSTYDWADNLLQTNRIHTDAKGQIIPLINRNTYDHVGRLENTYHRAGTAAEVLISNQQYTIKDQIAEKNLGQVTQGSTTTYLQSLDYSYNPQGWLVSINNATLGGSNMSLPSCGTAQPNPGTVGISSDPDNNDLFHLDLRYDNPQNGSSLNTIAQKNGNISQAIWRVRGRERQTYGYSYDNYNRLTNATYGEYADNGSLTVNNRFSTSYSYDTRGNINTLNRQGQYRNNDCWQVGQIDQLVYSYYPQSNRLQGVADGAPTVSREEGYKQTNNEDYAYDENGNMNHDPQKGLHITYNHLNLPTRIETDDCKLIEFSYDAAGSKLRKTVKVGSMVTSQQDYVDGIEYKNQSLEAIYHSEGRLYFDKGQSRYEYSIRDHLGNTRLTFSDLDQNGVIDVTGDEESSEILQENHYYPFGMQAKGPWMERKGRGNRYTFNGMEEENDLNLNWIHARHRTYDPVLCRWNQVDPLSEIANNWTPYRFAYNNPVRYTDQSGLIEEDDKERERTIQYDKNGNPIGVRIGYESSSDEQESESDQPNFLSSDFGSEDPGSVQSIEIFSYHELSFRNPNKPTIGFNSLIQMNIQNGTFKTAIIIDGKAIGVVFNVNTGEAKLEVSGVSREYLFDKAMGVPGAGINKELSILTWLGSKFSGSITDAIRSHIPEITSRIDLLAGSQDFLNSAIQRTLTRLSGEFASGKN